VGISPDPKEKLETAVCPSQVENQQGGFYLSSSVQVEEVFLSDRLRFFIFSELPQRGFKNRLLFGAFPLQIWHSGPE
jgi:hypothetical protein